MKLLHGLGSERQGPLPGFFKGGVETGLRFLRSAAHGADESGRECVWHNGRCKGSERDPLHHLLHALVLVGHSGLLPGVHPIPAPGPDGRLLRHHGISMPVAQRFRLHRQPRRGGALNVAFREGQVEWRSDLSEETQNVRFFISPLKIRRSGFQNFQSQEERTGIQRWEEFVFMWVLTSGLAQVGWELPFVLWKARARNLNKCFSTI